MFLQGLFRDLVGILFSVFIPTRLKKNLAGYPINIELMNNRTQALNPIKYKSIQA
jgi:hypothetical protein